MAVTQSDSYCTFILKLILLLCFFTHSSVQDIADCIFKVKINDTSTQIFDLTSLALDEWVLEIPSSDPNPDFLYLSLCHNHTNGNRRRNCSFTNASSCLVKEKSEQNLGHILSQPVLNSTVLELDIVNGHSCKKDNTTETNFTTRIFFLCSPEFGEPSFIDTSNCTMQIIWNTVAACPINSTVVMDWCEGTSQRSHLIDLRPLRHPLSYRVVGKFGKTYLFNICGTVNGFCDTSETNHITACQIDPATNHTISVIGSYTGHHHPVLEYKNEGLFLTYKSGNIKTEINFVCNTSNLKGTPRVLSENNKTYTFEFETSLVCQREFVPCVTYEQQGQRYDLSSLRKEVGNWEVSDPRPTHQKVKYVFNICKAVNPIKNYNCSDGSIAACRIGNNQQPVNLGMLQTGPKFQNGLSISFSGGSPCGRHDRRWRTIIHFECSRKDSDPVFREETEDCVIHFLWETKSACPVMHAVGENCTLEEPNYNSVFDLRPLHKTDRDFTIATENQQSIIRLNVCGNLHFHCNGYTNASACWHRGQNQIAIGFTNLNPHYTSGRIHFEFTGEECRPGKTSHVFVILMCVHDLPSGQSLPEMIPQAEECKFYFVWQTSTACSPFRRIDCHTTDPDGNVYDLSSLSDPADNYYIIKQLKGGNIKFILNVCRTLISNIDMGCKYTTGACMQNLTQPNILQSYTNMGEVDNSTGLQFKNGQLTLSYDNGAVCMDRSSNKAVISTTINFVCNLDDIEGKSPTFEGYKDCEYLFQWQTRAACSQNQLNESIVNESCVTVDPISEYRFNLTSLSLKDVSVEGYGHVKLLLRVCGSLRNSNCKPPQVGACLYGETGVINAGIGNGNLQFQNTPFLEYTNGDECYPGTRKSTRIEFVCAENNAPQGPVLVDTDSSNCTYVVHWVTTLACKPRFKCSTSNDEHGADISQLMARTSNRKIEIGDVVYYINVCRPLLPEQGLSCTGGSAICMAKKTEDGNLTKDMSLGFPYNKPLLKYNHILIEYINGSQCPTFPKKRLSSQIIFVCDHLSGVGSPEFVKIIDHCTYQFVWKTSVVCNSVDVCTIQNEINSNNTISLWPLNTREGFKVLNASSNFSINLCGFNGLCSGSPICKHNEIANTSYGRKMSWEMEETGIKLIFTQGDSCTAEPGKVYTSIIHLKCKKTGTEFPLMVNEEKCSVVLDWFTAVVCGLSHHAVDRADNLLVDDSHSSVVGIVLGLIAAAIVLGSLAFCIKKPGARNWCRNSISNLCAKRHMGHFRYSKPGGFSGVTDNDDWSDL